MVKGLSPKKNKPNPHRQATARSLSECGEAGEGTEGTNGDDKRHDLEW